MVYPLPEALLAALCGTMAGAEDFVESRRWAAMHLDFLRRFPGGPRFPGLAAVAMVEAEVERAGKRSCARRCYPCSTQIDAKTFANAARCHRHTESRLHRVMDVVFHADLSRRRSGFGPQSMATVRHRALNLFRGAKDKHSLQVRRKSTVRGTDYLEALLRQAAKLLLALPLRLFLPRYGTRTRRCLGVSPAFAKRHTSAHRTSRGANAAAAMHPCESPLEPIKEVDVSSGAGYARPMGNVLVTE